MKKILILGLLFTNILFAGGRNFKPATNKLFLKECGSCHFPFQPGLLPERSWVKIMGNLENHFQTDASLEGDDYKTLLAYMKKNASDHSMDYFRSKRMTNSIPSNVTPIRATKVPYFKHKHYNIKKSWITQKEVGSIINCLACHSGAPKGNYHFANIPNHK